MANYKLLSVAGKGILHRPEGWRNGAVVSAMPFPSYYLKNVLHKKHVLKVLLS